MVSNISNYTNTVVRETLPNVRYAKNNSSYDNAKQISLYGGTDTVEISTAAKEKLADQYEEKRNPDKQDSGDKKIIYEEQQKERKKNEAVKKETRRRLQALKTMSNSIPKNPEGIARKAKSIKNDAFNSVDLNTKDIFFAMEASKTEGKARSEIREEQVKDAKSGDADNTKK